jgi:ribose transport system ATP-binding protein
MTDPVALSVSHVSKTFGATRALDDVSLSFKPGRVTALLGENGSGKSTLIKVLSGAHAPDKGSASVAVGGQSRSLPLTPRQSHELGLRFLHQDLGLVPEATVADNVAFYEGFLSPPLRPLQRQAERDRTGELLARFEVKASPDSYVADLSPSEQTMVAIARAFGPEDGQARRIVVLDEPTAALPGDEVERVFRAIRRARQSGAAIILVSHRLEEVLDVADEVAVLRDGRVVASRPVEGLGADDLIELMLGHGLERSGGSDTAAGGHGDGLLRVRGLTGRRLRDVGFDLRAGEVLGVAGLVGSGRSELARLVSGAQRPATGTIEVDGAARVFDGPYAALAAGIVAVPQNRKRDGVILDMTVKENLTLGDLRPVSRRGGLGAINNAKERAEAAELIRRFDIRPPRPEALLRSLSGGNQQKVAIARAVRLGPRVLILDEPTQGVDVGARGEIGAIVTDLKRQGVAIVLATSDVDELLELADRVLILDRGRLREVLAREDITRDRLALALAGAALQGKAA